MLLQMLAWFLFSTCAFGSIPHHVAYPDGCRLIRAIGKKQCLPSIIINGQLKSGTTSLFSILAQHPQIMIQRDPFGRPVKEANSFWFREAAQNPKRYFHIMRQFPMQPLNGTRVSMEASPYYLSIMPDIGEDLGTLKRYIPNIKLVSIVRNPIDRAFSEFLMLSDAWNYSSVCNGTAFEDIVREELLIRNNTLLTDTSLHHSCLVRSPKFRNFTEPEKSDYRGRLVRWGEYAHYLKYWMQTFNSSQLYVLKTEDLKRNPTKTLADLVAWLGLEPYPLEALEYNRAGCRRSKNGACENEGTNKKVNTQMTYSRKVAFLLQNHFKLHNQDFAQLTGMEVGDWNTHYKDQYVHNAEN